VSHVAILGAGPIGAALAHRLAERGRTGAITLVDATAPVAAGKALDIMQSGPVERFDTRLRAADDVLGAAGASVVVVADEVDGGEWADETGLAMLQRLSRAGIDAPLVFAGGRQMALMELAWSELRVPAARLIGSAPAAVESALRAWAGLELNLSAVDVTLVGRPPEFVPVWSTASAAGSLLVDRVPAHRLMALSDALSRLWPPGPMAVASASAPIVEALIDGSRRLHSASTIVDGDLGVRGRAVLLPLDLGRGGVRAHVLPSLSPQERNDLLNSVAR